MSENTPPFLEDASEKILNSTETKAIRAIEYQIYKSLKEASGDTHQDKLDKQVAHHAAEKPLEAKLQGLENFRLGILALGGIKDPEEAREVLAYTESIPQEYVNLMKKNLEMYSPDVFVKPKTRQHRAYFEAQVNSVARLFIWKLTEEGQEEYSQQDLERLAVSAITTATQDRKNASQAMKDALKPELVLERNLDSNQLVIRTA